ncbi:ribosome small subunit-dependent GTPase A [Blautia stercoris]|jgi:ribosome biogenesis GTPase|uniref:ribosome small subunit-dependent GTPase A n=1 Tax=Blautia stercoris TaxID=871664 RepID=UPI0030511CE2
MIGKIMKGIAGFYYVGVAESGVYECKAKGIFRKDKIKPLVGDDVEIEVLNEEEKLGNIVKILPRRSELIRPAVANIDQALVIFAAREPKPNLSLLDRFLVIMEKQDVPVIICFNKQDLCDEEEVGRLKEIYEACGYPVVLASAKQGEGIEEIKSRLRGKTTTVAGPSGVGKSSLTNLLQNEVQMETGEISKKLGRGRHTTRHSQIIQIEEDTWLYDTPGFTSFYVEEIEKEELRFYFREFSKYEGTCRFQGCTHTHEPGCMVKNALEEGKISKERYENYLELYGELKEKRRY